MLIQTQLDGLQAHELRLECGHHGGGAGWTRTTDNAIMSRALYHLSYGTADLRLAGGLRPRLGPALLLPTLVEGYTLSLVHSFQARMAAGLGIRLVAEVGFEPTTFGL
jgi:hypothetical protein